MWEHLNIVITIIVALITFIATGATTIGISTWKVSQYLKQHETSIIKAISDHVASDMAEFSKIRTELDYEGDSIRREVGEGLKALRQVTSDLQLAHEQSKSHNLETYVRKQSFYEVIERITKEYKETTKELTNDIKSLTQEITKLNVTVKDNSIKLS